MAFDFLSQLSTTTGFLLVIIFILFIFSFKKVLGILKNALIIIAASVIFPLVAGKYLGLPLTPDADTVISFAFLGLFTYFIYLLANSIYKGLKLFEKSAKKLPVPKTKGEKTANEKQEDDAPAKKVHGAKPFIMRKGRKTKSWEHDYAEINDEKEE